mgnify:CR=1 FL=1
MVMITKPVISLLSVSTLHTSAKEGEDGPEDEEDFDNQDFNNQDVEDQYEY